MSAQYGAPGLGRARLATPSYTPSPQGSFIPPRSSRPPVVRRKALSVAAATLCAPALCAVALTAIGATGGGDQAAMGSLAGTQGLRGTTTPVVSSSAPSISPDKPDKEGTAFEKGDGSDASPTHRAQGTPEPTAPAEQPARHPAPTRPPHSAPAPHTHVTPPSVPTYDPTGPGAPTGSGSTGETSGTSGSDSGSDSGSGSSNSGSGSPDYNSGSVGSSDGYNAYSGYDVNPGGG
jgi:uncharacterized membrane protein YgcG